MPCTYCKNPKHTKRQCEEISKDFETYQKLTEIVRREYVDRLTSLGLVPNTLVRTYRRSGGMDTARISGLGFVDLFSCYTAVGRKWVGASSPTGENIVLDDDDERMVTPNHCYEILEAGDGSYDDDWITQQFLNEKVFRTLYKKRHVAFEMSVLNCVVKRLTQAAKTADETIEEVKMKEESVIKGESIYVVTATSTSDDYKRVYSSTESKTATSYSDAKSLAAQLYLERCDDWDTMEHYEELLKELADEVESSEDIGSTVYEFFSRNEDEIFEGEFVPTTFSVSISEQETEVGDDKKLKSIIDDIVERVLGE